MEIDESFDQLSLDNQLCFALYAATRAITRTYRQKLDPIGITYPQYLVFIVLWEKDGATLSEIGTALKLDSGTLTPIVQRLESQGFLKRKQRKSDERAREVWLTPKGLNLREIVISAREHVVCKLGMTDDQISSLRKELVALVDQLSDEPCSEVQVGKF